MQMLTKVYATCGMLVFLSIGMTIACSNPDEIKISQTTEATSSMNLHSTITSWGGLAIPAPDGAGPAEIWLDDYESRPNVLKVETGTTVTWINYDNGKPLGLTSDDGLFAVEINPPMGTFNYRFDYPGTFGYSIDPYGEDWKGVVIVFE